MSEVADIPLDTIVDLFKVQHLVEDATSVSTQISMRDMLNPRMAERIADDLVEVF